MARVLPFICVSSSEDEQQENSQQHYNAISSSEDEESSEHSVIVISSDEDIHHESTHQEEETTDVRASGERVVEREEGSDHGSISGTERQRKQQALLDKGYDREEHGRRDAVLKRDKDTDVVDGISHHSKTDPVNKYQTDNLSLEEHLQQSHGYTSAHKRNDYSGDTPQDTAVGADSRRPADNEDEVHPPRGAGDTGDPHTLTSKHKRKGNRTKLENMKCNVCDKHFSSRTYLLGHVNRIHRGIKSQVCNLCQKGFHTKQELTVHMRSHTGEKPYNCTVCDKRFSHLGNLKSHVKLHMNVKPMKSHVCNLCHKRFYTKQELTVHMRSHTGEQPYNCTVCDKRFSQLGNLKRHVKLHLDVKPFSCQVCKRTFAEARNLKMHVMGKHTGERPFPCNICGHGFVTSTKLKSHSLKHSKDHRVNQNKDKESFEMERFPDEKQSRFKTNQTSKGCERHLSEAVRNNNRCKDKDAEHKVKCNVCDKHYASRDSLWHHINRVHRGLKPVACGTCGKRFYNRQTLTIHMRSHTGEKPYACSVCSKRSVTFGNMKKHMMTHTGVKKTFTGVDIVESVSP